MSRLANISPPRIAISAGDPAGIGPDVVLALAEQDWPVELVVIADRGMLEARASLLGLNVTFAEPGPNPKPTARGELTVIHQPLVRACIPGEPDALNAPAILSALERMTRGCEVDEFNAMVTAPVSKATIAESGTPFLGHTEYLAQLTGAGPVVMLLATEGLRVALATTHLPLSEVPAAITRENLRTKLVILNRELKEKFGIPRPSISVLGLNPHAGESGRLGHEELDIIEPLLEELRNEGMTLTGPLPADTAFGPTQRASTDAYLAMYHDQGLPVLKFMGFGGAVNITLGLPIIRTSVDHGTAFDIAGTGKADSGSMFTAVNQALDLIHRALEVSKN